MVDENPNSPAPKEEKNKPPVSGKRPSQSNKWSRWIAGGIGIIFTAAVIFSFTKIDFQAMANAEYARGVITLLITVAFIILGVVLIITALFGPNDEEANDTAFRRAREIFSTVVGIVGTIVGFYFGSSTMTAPIDVSWKLDGTKLIVTAVGGKKPFKVVVTSDGKVKELVSDQNVFTIDACTLKSPKSDQNALEVADSTQMAKKAHLGRILDDKVQCPAGTPDQAATPASSDAKEKQKESPPSSSNK